MSPANELGPLRRVILQPTGFCNIDCQYCYLPNRSTPSRMPMEVVEAVGALLSDSELLAEEVEIRWHAGEPLTVKPDFYERACPLLAEALGSRARVRFSLQTNGMLIDDRWCDLFERHGIEVGVSIDGPAEIHDAHRLTRGGKGTFARAIKGVERLRERGLPVDLISVVTEETLKRRAEYLEFAAALLPRSIGLNPEETEGEHVSELFGHDGYQRSYREFLRAMHGLQRETGVVVRPLAAMTDRIMRAELPIRNEQVEPLMMLSVDVDGNMSTFSPELLGWKAPEHDDFVFGNVLNPDASLTEWTEGFRRLSAEIAEGREMCRRECQYFSVCGGGAAVNKWAENGTFASTVTEACRSSVMAVSDVVLDELEGELGAEPREGAAPVAR